MNVIKQGLVIKLVPEARERLFFLRSDDIFTYIDISEYSEYDIKCKGLLDISVLFNRFNQLFKIYNLYIKRYNPISVIATSNKLILKFENNITMLVYPLTKLVYIRKSYSDSDTDIIDFKLTSSVNNDDLKDIEQKLQALLNS